MICRAAGKRDASQILPHPILGEVLCPFGIALQGCPGEPAALEMPCGMQGNLPIQLGLILKLNELKAVTHLSKTEKQQQNSNRRGTDTQAIISVSGVGRLMKLRSLMNPTEMSS